MYYFYMGSVLLPIAPENLTLKVKNANKTLTLINEGEINILREAGLSEFDFKVLIPATQYSFAKYDGGFQPPAYFLDHFEKLKTSKEPFQFKVIRQLPNGKLLFDTDMQVALEDYTVDEKAKEGFDLLVSIKLKQYKTYGTKIVKVIEQPKPTTTTTKTNTTTTTKTDTTTTKVTVGEERTQQSTPPVLRNIYESETIYVVKEDRSLLNILLDVYGAEARNTKYNLYEKACAMNKDKLVGSYRLEKAAAGTTLVLPALNDCIYSKTLQSKYSAALSFSPLG